MADTKVIEPIELQGGLTSLRDRVSFVTTLLNSAESKVNHFHGLRQRNLMVAIAVFSGGNSRDGPYYFSRVGNRK